MAVVAVAALAWLLHWAKPLLLPLAIAIALTFLLVGPVRRLRRLGIPPPIGSAIVVASLLGAVTLSGALLAGPATEWVERAPVTLRQMGEAASRMRAAVDPDPSAVPRPNKHAAAKAPAAPDPISERIATEGLTITRAVIGRLVSFSLSAAATVILLYFFLTSEYWLVSRTVEALPRRRARALLLGGVRQAQREIGIYLGTMSLVNAALGFATALLLHLIGLPNPALWGVMTALLNFVPYFGPLAIAIVLTLAGGMTFGLGVGMLAPPAVFILLHAVESNLVTPWVIGQRLRLSPLSVFLSVMLWGWLWGFGGGLVAVPLLLALRAACRRTRSLKLLCVYLEGGVAPAPSLRSLMRIRQVPA
ncbi:MAG: AI-2E family transporter [Gemmatimonadota bacterium]